MASRTTTNHRFIIVLFILVSGLLSLPTIYCFSSFSRHTTTINTKRRRRRKIFVCTDRGEWQKYSCHRSGSFRRHSNNNNNNFRLYGTVYHPSWDDDSEPLVADSDSLLLGDGGSDNNNNGLLLDTEHVKEVLSEQPGSDAELARVAAAFCPTGKALDLRNHIEHVDVLSVDENHMDISAVLCGGEGSDGDCVNLAVPVEFPHSCSGSNSSEEMEECVLDNLHELDELAEQVFNKAQWEADHEEEIEAEQRVLKYLQSFDDLPDPKDWPAWWVRPSIESVPAASGSNPYDAVTNNLVAECDAIRKLLNEEGFREEVGALAAVEFQQQQQRAFDYDEQWDVGQAAVAAVGPAGILVRAQILRETLSEEDEKEQRDETANLFVPFFANDNSENNIINGDNSHHHNNNGVPLAEETAATSAGVVCDNADDLRECVLQLVDRALDVA